ASTWREAGMNRRPDGALEHDILAALWGSNRPLTSSEVLSQLDTELAYTSVATVLNRLHAKGLVERQMSGRAFRYRATVSEGEMVARSIGTALQSATDRRTAMVRFVSSLSKRDVRTLRSVLEALDR
ncbi:MAG: BlaI/MecI/CopY family transcriptional regulator, partial [Actinomycetota bacterium]|nr:BlaI/MecI/CopY family transcriptional regulator [Actinomycetota bacterium]